jgi:hypothetical protein
MTRWAGLLLCAVAVGFVLGSQIANRPQQLQAEDVRPAPHDNKVSEADVELYIAVYSAMQADHGLSIEEAVAGHKVSVDEFRDVERRVQLDQRMVDRVRLALLNQAKTRNTWAPPGMAAKPQAADPKN